MPEPAWSLQQRLRRRLLAWIAGLWLLGGLATSFGVWYETTEVMDSALRETAQLLMSVPDELIVAAELPPPGHEPHEEYVVFQVFDGTGALRMRSHQAPADPMDSDAHDGIRSVGPWYVLTMNRSDSGRRVQVAETREHRREVLFASAGWLLGALVVVLALAALVIRLLLTHGFATLNPARHELVLRPAHDLRLLPVEGTPIELHPWLQAVNILIARVRAAIDAERAFAAHTAHELRTPLAAARAQAQRLVHAAHDAEDRERAQALLRQLDRMTHLATRLLQLARIESGVALQREPVDLVQLANMVADEFAEARRQGRLQLQLVADSACIEGDIDALGIALRNLIDNALKHGGPYSVVTLRVEPMALTVIDTGHGVPSAQLPLLGQKFERGSGAGEGAGLGLAMVYTITQQSDARLVLQSPVADGHGFSASIRFGPHPA